MDYFEAYNKIDEITSRADVIKEEAPRLAAELDEAIRRGDRFKVFLIQMTMAARLRETDLMMEEVNTMRKEFGV